MHDEIPMTPSQLNQLIDEKFSYSFEESVDKYMCDSGARFASLKEQLKETRSMLAEDEQRVLSLRFGLDDNKTRTLEEVGNELNVTRERIRQIEAKALRKLRHPSRSRKLKDYLD